MIFIFSSSLAGHAVAAPIAPQCGELFANRPAPSSRMSWIALAHRWWILKFNRFTTTRDLKTYLSWLGNDFAADLEQVRQGGHWIDAGSGQLQALRDFVKTCNPGSHATLTAISLAPPTAKNLQDARQLAMEHGVVLNEIFNREVESLKGGDAPLASILTDIEGPLRYSLAPDRVLEAYGALLKVGGEVITLPLDFLVVDKYGHNLDPTIWLQQVSGFEIVPSPNEPNTASLTSALRLRKTGDVHAPGLKLIKLSAETPPRRVFLWPP